MRYKDRVMKIRITGTKDECELAKSYYLELGKQENVKSVEVSRFYPNRDSVNQYRVYVTVEYHENIKAGQLKLPKR